MVMREEPIWVEHDTLGLTYRVTDGPLGAEFVTVVPAEMAERFRRTQEAWDEMQSYLWDRHTEVIQGDQNAVQE